MSKLESLQDLFLEELRDLYNAENQITKALPKMAKAASTPELRDAFQMHLEQTEHQIERLERIFGNLGADPKGKVCKAMQGIIAEGEETIEEDATPNVKDAALIAAAQRVEHYEIAGYGTVRAFAEELGDEEAVRLLQQTLDEEGAADKKLTSLAEHRINSRAIENEGKLRR